MNEEEMRILDMDQYIIDEALSELVQRYVDYSIKLIRIKGSSKISFEGMILVKYDVLTKENEVSECRNYIKISDVIAEYDRIVRDKALTKLGI